MFMEELPKKGPLFRESGARKPTHMGGTTRTLNMLRPRLHGIGSKWDRIHLDPIHFLRGVYTGSDPELLAFTRDRIQLDFMNF